MIDELALMGVAAAAIALISCLSVEKRRRVRRLPRGVWVAVILLVPLAGPAAWFVLGRPHRLGTHRPIQQLITRQPPPSAPDDDPEFLRSLDPPAAGGREREEPHRRGEDLRRRDERRPDPGPDGAAEPPAPDGRP